MVEPPDVAVAALVILGVLVIGLAVASWIRLRASRDLAFLSVPIVLAGVSALALEVLSILGLVSRGSVTAVFVAATVLALGAIPWWWAGVYLWRGDLRRTLVALLTAWSTGGWWRWAIVTSSAMAVAVVVLSLVVALVSPPNNPDVLAYHLPRAMWWLQGGEVGTYVASDPRQLAFPPLNSYLLLVVLGISGSDLLVNLIQWSAALWACLGVVLIARRSGLANLSVLIVGILSVTIPTGITVATTAKADWLAALWPVLALGAVLSRSRGGISFRSLVFVLGATAALAAATKATAAVGVGLVVLLALWWEIQPLRDTASASASRATRLGRVGLVSAGSLFGVAAGFLPQALRTQAVYGNATGPDLDIVVTEPSLAIVWSNSIRTFVNNIGVPRPLSDWLNGQLSVLLPSIGVPVQDDAALHYDATLEVLIGRNEDFATNPIHLIAGLIAAAVVIGSRKSPARLRLVSLLVVVSFLVSVGLLQWNLWTNRLLLSVIVLASVPLGWLLGRLLAEGVQRLTLSSAVAAGLVLLASTYGLMIAVYQEYRPLIGPGSILTTSRTDQYFAVNDRPGTPGNMQERVLAQVRSLEVLPPGSQIGVIGVGPQEYLFWRFLNPDGRYTFVNLEGPNGPADVNLDSLEGVVCIDSCPDL